MIIIKLEEHVKINPKESCLTSVKVDLCNTVVCNNQF